MDIGMPVANLHRQPLRTGNLAQHIKRFPRPDTADDREIRAWPGAQIGRLGDLPASGHRFEIGFGGGLNRDRGRRDRRPGRSGLTGAQGDQESGGEGGATHGTVTFEKLTDKLAGYSGPP